MIALDPDKTTWLQLPEHKGDETKPAFKVRFATCRQLDQFNDLLDSAKAESKDKAGSAIVTQALGMFIVGWRNMPESAGVYEPGKIDDVVTWLEKWQLAFAYPGAITAAEVDLKNSGSPSESAGVASAQVAPAAADLKPAS